MDMTALQEENQRLKRGVEELAFLNDLSRAIAASLDSEAVMQTIISRSIRAVDAEQGAIILVDDEDDQDMKTLVRSIVNYGSRQPLGLNQSLIGWMYLHKKALNISDPKHDNRFTGVQWDESIQSVACVPLMIKSQLTGILSVYNKKCGKPFADEDLRLLSIIAIQSAQIIENTQLYAQLEDRVKQRTAQLQQRNEFIRSVFGRYLTDEVVANLLQSPENLRVGGEMREVTILVSDLRGFSTLSEGLSPEKVVQLINTYLGAMTDVIVRHDGTIDEFLGDGILVIFGAPIFFADHAKRAVACAVEMQLAMEGVNEQNRRNGLPEIAMGIGVNTGDVVVGNIGSEKRAKYGIVGSDVNLAYRIESYTQGGQILISQATRQDTIPLVRISDQMRVEPKGFSEPVEIYQVVGFGEKSLE